MIDQRFENHQTQRYYRLILSQDLFGDWVVTRVWGGIGQASGRIIHVSCASYEHAVALINKVAKTRQQRGYLLCQYK
ncbi:MAG: WGR domain-containing protein [Gammaproteobacteria bacterium]|nr:WGR domain-containing protein [Gammaproteobacteria bacterium]